MDRQICESLWLLKLMYSHGNSWNNVNSGRTGLALRFINQNIIWIQINLQSTSDHLHTQNQPREDWLAKLLGPQFSFS